MAAKVLETLQYYTPASLTNWWYGKPLQHLVCTLPDSPSDRTPLLLVTPPTGHGVTEGGAESDLSALGLSLVEGVRIDDRVREIIRKNSDMMSDNGRAPAAPKCVGDCPTPCVSCVSTTKKTVYVKSNILSPAAPTMDCSGFGLSACSSSRLSSVGRLSHIREDADSDSSGPEVCRQRSPRRRYFSFQSLPTKVARRRRCKSSGLLMADGAVVFRKRMKSGSTVRQENCCRHVEGTSRVSGGPCLASEEELLCQDENRAFRLKLHGECPDGVLSSGLESGLESPGDCDVHSHRSSSFSESSLASRFGSSWSEYTVSLPSTDAAEECRESDAVSVSTRSDVELSGNSRFLEANRCSLRNRKTLVSGHVVNEGFVDSECLCCSCVVM